MAEGALHGTPWCEGFFGDVEGTAALRLSFVNICASAPGRRLARCRMPDSSAAEH